MTDFYTTKLHDKAIITAVSGTGGGAKENMLDKKLNTIWKPAAVTAGQSIIIDSGTTVNQIDAFGIWIANYNIGYHTNGVQMKLMYSSDNFVADVHNACSYTTLPTDDPLNIIDLSSSITNQRYWAIVFGALGTAIEVAHIFLFRKRSHSLGHNLPVSDNPYYNNRNGRAEDQNKVDYISRELISDTTDQAVLDAAFEEMGGTRRLFVLNDYSGQYLCRLTHDKRKRSVIGHEFYKHQFDMETIPYVEDGETY